MTKDNKCPICKGINPPHPLDEYHRFLIEIQQAMNHLLDAEKLSKRLPSMKIPLEHSIQSVKQLNHEGLIC